MAFGARVGSTLVAMLTMALSAWAQTTTALEALPDSSKVKVVDQDPLMRFRLESSGNEQWDLDQQVVRAAFQIAPDMSVQDTPERTARAWLEIHGSRFGINQTDNLALIRHVESSGVHHLTFQQTHQGLPVYLRTVQVNLGLTGLPTMVLSAYAPQLEDATLMRVMPTISAEEAGVLAARSVSTVAAQTGDAVLSVYPSSPPRLVWQVMAWPKDAPGAWEVLVDAHTGQLVLLIDRLVYQHKKKKN